MAQWTIPEYLDAHPTTSYASVIAIFAPTAPPESADKISPWYTGRYNLLADNITDYEDALADGTTPDAALKMALAQWGTANVDETKPALPENPVTPTDPDDPVYQNNAMSEGGGADSGSTYGNIRNYTSIGPVDVSFDVISMSATMATGYEEGNEQANCQVVLHNRAQKYGKLIADFVWTPRVTKIWSMVEVKIHDPETAAVTTNEYMFFQGFMSDAKWNNETVTVEFGCISVDAAGAYDDESWSPEDGYEPKMKDMIKKIEDEVDQKFPVLNLKLNPALLTKQHTALSDISGAENLRSIAQDNKETFYFAQDFEDNMYVVLYDSKSRLDNMLLDPYVIEPGDTSNVFGHSNQITVVGGPTDPSKFMRHVPTPVKAEVFYEWNNAESQDIYGVNPTYIKHELNLPAVQVEMAAVFEDDNLKTYVDRDIKVVVANKIPKLLTVIMFTVRDVSSGVYRQITAGVKKKQVEYSSNGIICHIEAARLAPNEGGEETNISNGIVTSTEMYTDANDVDWQYRYINGEWELTRSEGWSLPQTYDGDIPSDVSDHFGDMLSNIESANDAIDPAWRT